MNQDNEDLFSYERPQENSENSLGTFDLGSFSSVSNENEEQSVSKKGGKKSKRGKKERILKTVLTLFLIGVITCSIVVSVFMVYVFTMVDGTMDENLNELALNFTTTIYVENTKSGEWEEYQRLHGTFNRIWSTYDETKAKAKEEGYDGIPQNLVNAFVAIEDRRFFEHDGVDWKRTAGAFVNMFVPISKGTYGGSTITQQLVKNLTGDNSRKPSRKIREIMRSRYFEKNYSKPVIVECYLNTIPLGHGLYGVEVASNYYFNKSVNELTIAECACLAAITQRPTDLSPDDNPEANKTRRSTVLYQMYNQGYITKEEYDAAKAEEIKIVANDEALNESEVNSYFVDALIGQVTDDLVEKYGYERNHASNLFYTGGYKIYATVDTSIQAVMESIYANTDKYQLTSKSGQKLQSGMTLMDYQGNVKGMVGGFGEKTSNRGWNNATDSVRQPGSSMKPISAYAPAIEQNMIHYSSIVNDISTNYNGWTPNNWYTGYWGNITVQYAIERSVNTIPVYLVNKLSPQTSFDFLVNKLGITTLNQEDINLAPLGMGGTNGGITTLESAAAYAIFGNGGLYYKPTLYTKVLDQRDNVVLDGNSKPSMAISEDTATVMNHLLQTVIYGENGTGKSVAAYMPTIRAYGKTGTSNNDNDMWFVGGSPYYVGSCWCGYKNLEKITGGKMAIKIWGDVMSEIHKGKTDKDFVDSDYTVKKYYCTETGQIATNACTSSSVGWYKKDNIPSLCTVHKGDTLPVPDSEEDIARLEAAAQPEEGEVTEGGTESTEQPAESQNQTGEAA